MTVVWMVWAALAAPLGWFAWVKFRAHPVLVSVWTVPAPVPAVGARQVMPLEPLEPSAVIPPPRRELEQ